MEVDWLSMVKLPAVWSFIAAGLGAYFGPYLKKKGENLATKEDLQLIVDQVSAVTKTTEEINAQISNEVWDRQKRWEMKKEAAIDVMKATSALRHALFKLGELSSDPRLGDEAREARAESRFREGLEMFMQAEAIAALVCNKTVHAHMKPLMKSAFDVGDALENDKLKSDEKVAEFRGRLTMLQAAIRDDLGIGPVS
jgi:hypothetical protein